MQGHQEGSDAPAVTEGATDCIVVRISTACFADGLFAGFRSRQRSMRSAIS